MEEKPADGHAWLQKLVGEWTSEMESVMGPDQQPLKSMGTESVRSLGGLWTIDEGEWDMPDGGRAKSIMTLGYDPKAERFVGTFVASMMTHLWIYSGTLDGDVLALDAEGPSFTGDGTGKYQDRIEFVDDDHRVMTSQTLGDDGQWHRFMTVHYYRQK